MAASRPTRSGPTISSCPASSTARLIIAYRNGAPVRLSDVADVIDDAENVKQAAWMNRVPAVILNIQRQPGANIIEVADRIKELLPKLKASLPAAVEVTILTDRTTTIRASVQDVQFELMLTIALVVMVMFLFLRTLAATVIPSVAVPLSLVGTFGVMYLLGYSLNNLSLMALTISTGFVVDDAIVMIENIARYIEEGEPPLEAALKGAEQIGFTILSLTVSLIAVLIPLLFMGDIVGRLFREFAVTLSVTILVSAVVSLTLTPMMCASLLRHKPESRAGLVLPGLGARLQSIIALLRPDAALGAPAPDRHAPGGRRHPRADDPAVHHRPQGLLPRAGYRRHPGHFRGAADDLLRGDGRTPAGSWRRSILQDPGGREPVVLHRRRRDEHDAQQRAHPDQPEAARRAAASAPATSSAGCNRQLASVEGITPLHAAGAGPDRRRPRQPDAVSVQPRRSRSAASWPRGSRGSCAQLQALPHFVTSPATSRTWACRRAWSSTATRRPASASRPQTIDDTLYDAFGQRQISTMFTQSNQYRVVLEAVPRSRRARRICSTCTCSSAAGGAVPLSAFTRIETSHAPLAINHQGQFPV